MTSGSHLKYNFGLVADVQTADKVYAVAAPSSVP